MVVGGIFLSRVGPILQKNELIKVVGYFLGIFGIIAIKRKCSGFLGLSVISIDDFFYDRPGFSKVMLILRNLLLVIVSLGRTKDTI